MNLLEMIEKMLDEDKWREKQAQKLSSGLGSLPYSFDEQMQLRAPMLLDMYRRTDTGAQKNVNAMNKLGSDMPEWFPERFWLKEAKDKNEQDLMKKYKSGV